MTEMGERRWMRVAEAAAYASIGVVSIRKLIKSRQLRAIDLGRSYLIDRLDLDACLEKLKSRAAQQSRGA